MEEENGGKRISVSKKAFWLYMLCSFLLVTIMIFAAVMITYNSAVSKIGATYAEQLALANNGVTEHEVTDLKTKQTFFNGENVFEVSYHKDGERHIVYVNAECATITHKTVESIGGAPNEIPETNPDDADTPAVEGNPDGTGNPDSAEEPEGGETPDITDLPDIMDLPSPDEGTNERFAR